MEHEHHELVTQYLELRESLPGQSQDVLDLQLAHLMIDALPARRQAMSLSNALLTLQSAAECGPAALRDGAHGYEVYSATERYADLVCRVKMLLEAMRQREAA